MSTPLHGFVTGTFVSDGTAVTLNVPTDVQEFDLINLSSVGSVAATTPVMWAKWMQGMDNGEALYVQKTNGAATLQAWTSTLTGGMTRIADSGDLAPGPALAQTATSNADPIVVSTVNTGSLAVGDIVRLIDNTDAQQITNVDWTVTAINAGVSFTLGYTGTAPGSAGTGGFFRRIPFQEPFYPRRRFITAISQAANAVIELSVTHGFTAGQRVKIIVPEGWGMVEANNLYATITAINTTNNTITVDLDTSGFTAFAWPASAVAAGGVSYPQVVPVGMAATSPYENLLDDATFNTTFRGIVIGTTVQTNGETYRWVAKRGVTI